MLKHIALATALTALASSASALTWNWASSNSLTFGTFTTDGDELNGAAGQYKIIGFLLKASPFVAETNLSD